MKYKLLFNKLKLEYICDCNQLTHTIDTVIMNNHKAVKNCHMLNYQMYGNGHGSNVEIYFNGTLLEIVEVSKA